MATLVEAHDLGRSFLTDSTETTVLRSVTLTVDEAEFVTIMGPSGSGKSTLLHCLSGMDRPSRGTVKLGTTDLFRVSEKERTLLRRDSPAAWPSPTHSAGGRSPRSGSERP